MDPRLEALSGIGTVVLLFVPVLLVICGGVNRTRKLRESERERRIAAYRQSPDSQLLRLNY
jgi:hypothetical protein